MRPAALISVFGSWNNAPMTPESFSSTPLPGLVSESTVTVTFKKKEPTPS